MPASFPSMNNPEVEGFFRQYQSWEKRVKDQYEFFKRDQHFAYSTSHSLDLGEMLRGLNKKTRERLLLDLRGILRFDEHVTHENVQWIGPPKGRDSIARITVADPGQIRGYGANPLAVFLNNLSIQYDAANDAFGFGANLPTTAYARSMYRDSTSGYLRNGRMVVWDSETTGLLNESGIRQLSSINVDIANQMHGPTLTVGDTMENIHFRTARMQHGYLADRGANTRQMNQVIEHLMGPGFKYQNAVPGAGDDYARAIIPFIQNLIGADYIAGQNIKFDLDKLTIGLTHTAVYHENTELQGLVEQLRRKIQDPNVIRDTLARAKAVLPNLQPSRELLWAGEKRTHSLENLLLETNLAQLIRRDLRKAHGSVDAGDRAFRAMFKIDEGGALHASDIDTRLSAYLAKYLYEPDLTGNLEIRQQTLGGDPILDKLRRMVLKSSAFTPMTHLTDISHIDKDIFARMLTETQAGGNSIRIMGRGVLPSDTAEGLWNLLNKEDAPFARFKMTPLEQEIIKERQMLKSAEFVDSRQLLLSMGQWRSFAAPGRGRGILNKAHDLFKRGVRPPREEFDVVRRSMAEAGIPFAGLSQHERWITHSLALAGTHSSDVADALSPLEAKVAAVSDDLGIIRIAAQKASIISDSKKNISLPLQVLRAAAEGGVIGEVGTVGNGLRTSIFQSADGYKAVNFVQSLSQRDAQALADWLSKTDIDTLLPGGKTLRELGFHGAHIKDIIEALPTAGVEHGVAVGYLNKHAGFLGYGAIESLHQALVTDESQLPLRAAIMPGEFGFDGDTIRLGAMRLDRPGITMADDAVDYEQGMNIATRRFNQLMGVAEDSPGFFAAASRLVDHTPNKVVQSALLATEAFGKRLPLIGAVAGGLGFSYYVNKRRKEQNIYDETLSPQPIESASDYDRYRQDLGLPKQKIMKRIDPLLTAGVVGNADRRSIGHSNMGNNRYDYLFGGV